jgi:hypothetical protein
VYEETYEDAEYHQYEAECVIYDDEGDRFLTEGFDEQRKSRSAHGPRPYADTHSEVAYWRLELTLNELGRAFWF